MSTITVLLTDDHKLVRQGLRALLENQEDFSIVGEAENGWQAVSMTKRLAPEVIVMDIAMPFLNGLEATRQISRNSPDSKVLVLSMYGDDEYVRRLVDAGASGYLLKQSAAQDLMAAIRETRKGNSFFSPSISRKFRHRPGFAVSARDMEPAEQLTPRQSEVLQHIADGHGTKKIAGELSISVKTVEKHRQDVMDKLDIHDIAGLTRYAVTTGIVENQVSATPEQEKSPVPVPPDAIVGGQNQS